MMKLPLPAVSASVSCMDIGRFDDDLKRVEQSGVSFLHYDVVDGVFNKCLIMGDLLFDYIKKHSSLPIEVHLAVSNPKPYIELFAGKGADYIALHYESFPNVAQLLAAFDKIRNLGSKPILAYRCDTVPLEDLATIGPFCEWILKLTVNPGFSGQKMQPEALKHIATIRRILDKYQLRTRIQADGNVNPKTAAAMARAGADIFTGGTSGLFTKGRTIDENIDLLLAPVQQIVKDRRDRLNDIINAKESD